MLPLFQIIYALLLGLGLLGGWLFLWQVAKGYRQAKRAAAYAKQFLDAEDRAPEFDSL